LAADDQILEVSDLRAGYGPLEVLHGVSLSATKGEVIGVFGRNGAGKTTLLEAITGVISVKQGKVVLGGIEVTGKPAYKVARKGMALVPQWRGLFPGLSTLDNLRLGCRGLKLNRAETKGRVEEILERFPVLVPRTNVRAGDLSGGEQQILAIAKALVRRPDVLCLDEPSIGLAPIIVDQVAEVINGLRGSDCLIILSEQRIDWAIDTVDHGYVIEGGQLVSELLSTTREKWQSRIEEFLGTRISESKNGVDRTINQVQEGETQR
jgi:branched-chain amino acid transport system ATP-binding protein